MKPSLPITYLYILTILSSIVLCVLFGIEKNWLMVIIWLAIGVLNGLSLKNELE